MLTSRVHSKWCIIYSLAILTAVTALFILNFNRNAGRNVGEEKDHNFLMSMAVEFSLSKSLDVVPMSAYFDNRPQDSHHNVTVILASVLQQLESTIIGCNVDGVVQRKPEAWSRTIALAQWIQGHHPVTHVDMIVRCYDMDIHENSLVSLLYVVNGTGFKAPVKTSLVMPQEGPEIDGVMICATGFGSPKHLEEWLTYQQIIGVKFIHLNVDASFLQNVDRSEKLQELMKRRYVNILVWEEFLKKGQVFLYSQSLRYQDCLHRYLYSYKYMMIVDFDEYFVPLGTGRDIDFYTKLLFGKKNTGSVKLVATLFLCKRKLDESLAIDGNLTRFVNASNRRGGGAKSIHLVKAIQEVSVHNAIVLLPPYKLDTYWRTQWSKCYFAHIKADIIC